MKDESQFVLVGIRGLMRGNAHWGKLDDLFKLDGSIHFETLEIPGNGTLCEQITPVDVDLVITSFRNKIRTHLDHQRPVFLLGVSLGGMVALKWAELFPTEISGVITINTSLNQNSNFYQRLNWKNYLKVIQSVTTNDFALQEKNVLELTSNVLPENFNLYLKKHIDFAVQYPLKSKNFLRQLILASRIFIAKIDSKKTLILASKKDNLVDWTCSKRISSDFNLEFIIHNFAGHDMILDDPKWVFDRVNEFIQRIKNVEN